MPLYIKFFLPRVPLSTFLLGELPYTLQDPTWTCFLCSKKVFNFLRKLSLCTALFLPLGSYMVQLVVIVHSLCFFLFWGGRVLATPQGMLDLEFPNRAWTHAPCSGSAVLTSGPPGSPHSLHLNLWFLTQCLREGAPSLLGKWMHEVWKTVWGPFGFHQYKWQLGQISLVFWNWGLQQASLPRESKWEAKLRMGN